MNIYVGNLPFETTEDELENTFSTYGEVTSAKIISDRETGRSRGFAFVEMASDEEGTTAIQELNGYEFKTRPLRVNEARSNNNRNAKR